MDVFCQKVAQTMASMHVDLQRIDVVAFCGGIGENASFIRRKLMDAFRYRGWRVDEEMNARNGVRFDVDAQPWFKGGLISHDDSSCQAVVVATDEEKQIELDTKRVLGILSESDSCGKLR